MTDEAAAPGERDPLTGRFLPGNTVSKLGGSPLLRRRREMADTLAATATPEQLREVLDRMRLAALDGDVAAAGVYLAHVIGKPREQAPPVEGLELPADLATANGIADALAAVLRAAAAGDLHLDAARDLAGLVERVAEAGALADLDRRLAALEQDRPR